MKKKSIYYSLVKRLFQKAGLGFIFCCFIFYSCQSRSDFRTESHSDRDRALDNEEIQEKASLYKEEKLMDTIIYESPQEQGGFLSAPDDVYLLLWGNKSDKPIRGADSNVVFVSFIIEPDSTASSVRVLRGMNPEMDSIAVQAVRNAKWKPGYVNDLPVRSRFNFPIVF